MKTKAKALLNKDAKFTTIEINRRELKDTDILIEIKYAGICHSDIHSARSEWSNAKYPIVPGHEIAGVVKAIGKNVSKFKVNDNAGVGCLVNSCKCCEYCNQDYQQLCSKSVSTYNSIDSFNDNEITYGGYSQYIVVDQDFAIKVPQDAPLEYVAPLLCAGITMYSPINFSKVKKDDNVAVLGFGGLGMMGVKYALSLGANVYVFARNKNKQEICDQLKVKKLYTNTNEVDVKFDLILSTIPNKYDLKEYLKLLKIGGEIAIIGLPAKENEFKVTQSDLIFNTNKRVYGSLIGGIQLTQQMLDYSLKNKIYPEIEIISIDQIDEAYDKLTNGTAKFRYVIDMSTFK